MKKINKPYLSGSWLSHELNLAIHQCVGFLQTICFDRDTAGPGNCHRFLWCSKWQRHHKTWNVRESVVVDNKQISMFLLTKLLSNPSWHRFSSRVRCTHSHLVLYDFNDSHMTVMWPRWVSCDSAAGANHLWDFRVLSDIILQNVVCVRLLGLQCSLENTWETPLLPKGQANLDVSSCHWNQLMGKKKKQATYKLEPKSFSTVWETY